MSDKPILVFQTDFTYKEGAVSAMYGVVKSVDRSLEIISASHELPQYDIWSASYRLQQYMKFWPEGTVFISVVDPGVGTSRRACMAKTKGGYYVATPDNGTLTHVMKWTGLTEIREIDEKVNRLRGKGTEGVGVFHGRDLFGYCAARFASGIISYSQVGPDYLADEVVTLPVADAVCKGGTVTGIFEISDPNFGNLWTNIPFEMFSAAGFVYGDYVNVTICHNGSCMYNKNVLFGYTFGAAEKGEDIIYNNELMRISMAISQGNFCEKHGLGYGSDWTVKFSRLLS